MYVHTSCSVVTRLLQGAVLIPAGRRPLISGTSPNLSSVISLESLPTSDLPEVPYDVLKKASGHFDQLAYREGGHKLGSGGFGEVFHCQLNLLGAEREVAVKALLTKVNHV